MVNVHYVGFEIKFGRIYWKFKSGYWKVNESWRIKCLVIIMRKSLVSCVKCFRSEKK